MHGMNERRFPFVYDAHVSCHNVSYTALAKEAQPELYLIPSLRGLGASGPRLLLLLENGLRVVVHALLPVVLCPGRAVVGLARLWVHTCKHTQATRSEELHSMDGTRGTVMGLCQHWQCSIHGSAHASKNATSGRMQNMAIVKSGLNDSLLARRFID